MSKELKTPKSSDEGESVISNGGLSIFKHTKIITTHNIYLTNEIGDQSNYTELFNLLRNVKDDEDVIKMYINNVGGSCVTGIELINSMRACQAAIYVIVTGPLYSMAPLIALQGDKILLEDHMYMMFHDYSTVLYGKGGELEAHIKTLQQTEKDMMYDYCRGFLTKKEMRDTFDGKDLYLNRAECERRLLKMGKLLQ